MTESGSDELAPLFAMIDQLPTEAVDELGRMLHARLNAPPSPAERRVKQLRFLRTLLEERPQRPDRLPYFAPNEYVDRRETDVRQAPQFFWLQEPFGTWAHSCFA